MKHLSIKDPVAFQQHGRFIHEGIISAIYKESAVCTFANGCHVELNLEVGKGERLKPLHKPNDFGVFLLITDEVRYQLEIEKAQLQAAVAIDTIARNVKKLRKESLERLAAFLIETASEIETNQGITALNKESC